MKHEMELGVRRGDLIHKKLVVRQLSWLMVSMRQKILALPHTWTRRLTGISDNKAMKSKLEEMARSLLDDLRQIPKTVDSQWEASLDGDQA